jgi:hypothetical protein
MAFICDARVNGNGVNFRSGAALNSTSLGLMYSGEKLTTYDEQVYNSTDGYTWELVLREQTNQIGWVASQFVTKVSCRKAPDEPSPNVIATPGPTDSKYFSKGSHDVTIKTFTGPLNSYTMYYPSDLTTSSDKYPAITWGNGTDGVPVLYDTLLKHFASHGFVVIASNSTMTGDGSAIIAGAEWLISENSSSGSFLYGKIDTANIGATGHSQGGGGAINAGKNQAIKCTAPIAPMPVVMFGVKMPMFLVTGSADMIIPTITVKTMIYILSAAPTILAELKGATHLTVMSNPTNIAGYVVAWFYAQLKGDENAKGIFYGYDYRLQSDSNWNVSRKKF